jgi:hypothetical protein
VIFLHGWHGCVRAILASTPTRCRPRDGRAEGLGLAQAFDASERAGLLLVPQLAWRARDGSEGRFRDRGVARDWLAATLRRARLGGRRIARLTIVAHSAGFKSASALLERGNLPNAPTDLVLLDALYARTLSFARWTMARPSRRLVVVHTDSTARETHRLRRWARGHIPADAWLEERDARERRPWGSARIVLRRTSVPHARVPAEELSDVLRRLR